MGKEVKIKTHQGIFKDVLCIAKEETFEVITQIIDEFIDVFPGEYIHIGGDETPADRWKECPECQKYMKEHGITDYAEYQTCFTNRIIDYLEKKNRHAIVWNEATMGGNLDKRATVQYWKEAPESTVKFLNEGGKAFLSPFSYFYLDYDYSITPLNRVYSMKPELPGLTEKGKKNIIGIEAPVWTEYIDNINRLEELVFPRIIAVSKIALGKADKPYKDFLNDAKTLRKQLDTYCFCNEKDWTKPRTAFVWGWLKFVKDHYTLDYIKEQIL
jgi:hexosaminidase